MIRFSVELPNLHPIFKFFSVIFLTNVNFYRNGDDFMAIF